VDKYVIAHTGGRRGLSAFLPAVVLVMALVSNLGSCAAVAAEASSGGRPNILLIAIDDLNDWIGCLGGHPQAKTPNIDRLAARGVLFANAHCQSPVCNPSRASMMTSLYPATTGIYFLSPDLAESPIARQNTLLPKRFEQEGYHVTGAGKIFHGNQNNRHLPNWAGSFGGFAPYPEKKLSSFPGVRLWDWGVYPERDELLSDHKIAAWAVEQLQKQQDKPQLLAVGFYQPHVPQYAPQKWFDMYPMESLQLPEVLANDLDDLSDYGINLTRLEHVAPAHDWVVKNEAWKPLVQSYLACVSFVDHQVGRLLDALDNCPAKDNTLVVLYSDHGFHLGEKERWAKRSLWEDSTRVPLIIAGPGVARGKVCNKPVQLLDVYPTLLEVAGLKQDDRLEGHSMTALLKDPAADWPYMARTSFGPGNYAIRSESHRYIHYNDGSEELYDHANDPHEWHNLIENPDMAATAARHRAFLPEQSHPVLGSGSTGHRAFHASEATKPQAQGSTSDFDPLDWRRPVDNPVFTSAFGNNHDSILFVEPEQEYPYHLIISHTKEAAQLWRAKKFSWSSADWELVSDHYQIGEHYEYDDGVKVDGTWYIYEEGIVYTYSGPLEDASGKWQAAGTFPHQQCDDVGVYYEDGVFHMFGEHGHFPHGPDGTSLAHFTSTTGLGDWKLVNAKAVDPNPEGGHTYGVGDATIARIEGHYYIFCDRESQGSPYKVVAWRSKDIHAPFEYLGEAITPRSDEVDDWDNYRIQDPDIAWIPELGRHVMTCNMMDRDGNPGGDFPTLKGEQTRVIGVFYHGSDVTESDAAAAEKVPGL
jgi:arylsulfatase A-like enzyme